MSHAHSHFIDLLSYVQERLREMPSGVAVAEVAAYKTRTDGFPVFDEGRVFSGITARGVFESCVTIAAAPYLPPQVPRERFLTATRSAFPRSTISDASAPPGSFPEHLVVWWRSTKSLETRDDLLGIARLPNHQRRRLHRLIADQTARAVFLLKRCGSTPTIAFSWGYGCSDDRITSGLTRGVPTNNLGHLHVVAYRDDPSRTAMETELESRAILELIAPWNHLLLVQLGDAICEFIDRALRRHSTALRAYSIQPYTQTTSYASGAVAHEEGVLIDFDDAPPLADVLAGCSQVALAMEKAYREIVNGYLACLRFSGDLHVARPQVAQLDAICEQAGLSTASRLEVVKFLSRLRPTMGQVVRAAESREDGEFREVVRGAANRSRQRVEKLRSHRGMSDMRVALLADAYADPLDSNITQTWPVHFSWCAAIQHYSGTARGLRVHQLKLFPGIASTSSVTEPILGTYVRRGRSSFAVESGRRDRRTR